MTVEDLEEFEDWLLKHGGARWFLFVLSADEEGFTSYNLANKRDRHAVPRSPDVP